ncbi:MAG: Mut7-C RNAse domain-containing protein [Promethearchaeota archaeon]
MALKATFIVDAMLGSLARWLRLLGYDTLYCETQSDDEILERVDSRILLTRDKELMLRAKKLEYRVLNPGSKSVGSMLKQLQQTLRITFLADPDLSRCPKCNAPLQKRNRVQVRTLVPKGSLKNHQNFWQCTNKECQKVYWQGRHWTRIKNTLNKLDTENKSS